MLAPSCPAGPPAVLEDIDAIIKHQNGHSLLTSSRAIPPYATISRGSRSSAKPINLSLWKGDSPPCPTSPPSSTPQTPSCWAAFAPSTAA